MIAHLRVLLIQHSVEAGERLLRTLRDGGYQPAWVRVETAEALTTALDAGSWDIVLAGHASPTLGAMDALLLIRGRGLDTPMIVVPGEDDVETAVAAIRAGANDYLRDANSARLLAAIEREAGAPAPSIGVSSHITACVRADKALRASKTWFWGAFDGSVTSMSLVTAAGQILQVNPSLCALLGYSEAELLSRNAQSITHPDDWGASEEQIRRLLDGEATEGTVEKRFLHQDGHPIWVQMSTSLQRDVAGRPLYFINQLQDITGRMRLESDLHAREEQLRTIATNAPLIIHAADRDGTLTLSIGDGLRNHGVQAGAQVGLPIREVFAHLPDMLDLIGRAYAGRISTAMTGIGGRTFEAHWWPTRDASGAIVGVTGLALDLTDRVRADAEHARLAAIVTSSQYAIIGTTLEGLIESWNAGATRLYGYGPEETIGRSILLISPPDRIHEAPQVLHALRHGGATAHFVTVRLHKDGHAIDVAITLSATIDGTGAITGTASITRDITELKHALRDADLARSAAEELARVRNEHATEVEAMAQATIALSGALDPAELYVRILEHVARVVPCDLANVMIYQDGWAVVAASWGDERLTVGDKLFPLDGPGRLWAPEPQSGPCYLPDTADEPNWKDIPPRVGTRRIRSLISVPLLVDGTLLGSFDVGSVTKAAYSPRQTQLVAIFGERVGQALRNARLYAAERERARVAEDLAAMRSDFVAAVSHELRTPLTAVLGYAELLQDRWAHLSDGQRLDQIARIVVSANRQHRLVADLLLISQIEDGVLAVRAGLVLLTGPINGAAQEVRATYRDQQIEIEGPAALGVRADPDRVLQIVGNLLDNAAKYSPEGSPITVSWRAEERWGTIRVRDHGPGIPLAHRDVLFTRFGRVPGSRTRSGHVGTGLGLYLGRQLAEVMDGKLDLESTGPEGSTFTLRLPFLEAYPGRPGMHAGGVVIPYVIRRSSTLLDGDDCIQAAVQAKNPCDSQDKR